MRVPLLLAIAAALLSVRLQVAAQAVPDCRMDDTASALVAQTLNLAARTYKDLGKELPFDRVVVNPRGHPTDSRTLRAYIVTDASSDGVGSNGCATRPTTAGEPLDALSVRGGCVVVSAERAEVRCSSKAVAVFGAIGKEPGRASPALLYVLSHELGHLHQRAVGEYQGRAIHIDLAQPRDVKLKALQTSCEPASTKREEDADTLAMEVMKRLLPNPPYHEPLFSEQGSLLWSVDQLVLAASAWQEASLEVEFLSRPKVHPSFVPTEFPTPSAKVKANARKFVCDTLTGTNGSISHPLQSATHPALDQRMGRIAAALKPIAASLPNDTQRTQFESVARLQSQLSPIFSHIYRETGVYMGAVQDAVCTLVNAAAPPSCR